MRAFKYLAAVIALTIPGVGLTEGGTSGLPVEIAAVYNTTGAQSDLDGASLLGARLAIAEANRNGGFQGRPFKLVVAEGNSNPLDVAKVTETLVASHPRIAVFFGLSDTDMVLAAAPKVVRSSRAFVTSGATSPELPAQVPGGLFLACFGDNVQAAAAAEWVYGTLRARTVAILSNRSMSYTRLLQWVLFWAVQGTGRRDRFD